MEVTVQPRPTATLHIRDPGGSFVSSVELEHLLILLGSERVCVIPRNPLPPQTTIFFDMGDHGGAKRRLWKEEAVMESKGFVGRGILLC